MKSGSTNTLRIRIELVLVLLFFFNVVSARVYGDLSPESDNHPVALISFEAKYIDDQIELSWKTASEVDNNYFEVFSSADGIEFNIIGTLEGNENSNLLTEYGLIDSNPPMGEIVYYQLKQVDFDGKETYSKKVSIKVKRKEETKIFPNPVFSDKQLNVVLYEDTKGLVEIYNSAGRLVQRSDVNGENSVVLINNLKSGFYMVKIISEKRVEVKEIIVL